PNGYKLGSSGGANVVGNGGQLYVPISNSSGGVGYLVIEGNEPMQMPSRRETNPLGQLINPDQPDTADVTLNFKLRFNYLGEEGNKDNLPAGFSFRVQDYRNMYRLEVTPTRVFLYKIVDGVKTKLSESGYVMTEGSYVPVTIKATGSAIKVKMNGFVVSDVTDSTFTTGKFGPFS
ncbi:hypothetical protein, partial [Paenibacillus sp. y28]|uniref:hypothetical protein n=1 Tax=Paenibacillus sp. y28 TaxID=3129110 RepID=UPI003016E7A9